MTRVFVGNTNASILHTIIHSNYSNFSYLHLHLRIHSCYKMYEKVHICRSSIYNLQHHKTPTTIKDLGLLLRRVRDLSRKSRVPCQCPACAVIRFSMAACQGQGHHQWTKELWKRKPLHFHFRCFFNSFKKIVVPQKYE